MACFAYYIIYESYIRAKRETPLAAVRAMFGGFAKQTAVFSRRDKLDGELARLFCRKWVYDNVHSRAKALTSCNLARLFVCVGL